MKMFEFIVNNNNKKNIITFVTNNIINMKIKNYLISYYSLKNQISSNLKHRQIFSL